jgi:hypothetical protein
MDEIQITSAQYVSMATNGMDVNPQASIKATINSEEMFVPIDSGNVHFAEIMRQVEAGTLTIEDAD